MKKLLGALLVVGALWGQDNNPITMKASAPTGVTSVNAQLVGNPGPVTSYYWVIAHFPIGTTKSVSGRVINAPNTLTGSNYVKVSWGLVNGASTYDLLKTSTNTLPTSCTCSLANGLTANTYNDTGGSLSSYSFTPAPNATTSLRLDNQNYSLPVLYINSPINTALFATLPAPATVPQQIWLIADSSSTTTCSAGGGIGTPALCWSTGSAWVPLGSSVSGGTTTIQVNGVNTTSQNPANWINSSVFNGLTLTFTNPAAGNIQIGATGTLNNSGLTNSSITINSTPCTLGSTCTIGGLGTGTVTTFSAGTLSPLFTTSVANPTTTPALTFTLSNFGADNIFGNFTGGSAAPSTQVIPACANDGAHALVYVSHVLTCEAITTGGTGTVTNFTAGTLAPLFTTSVATSTSTPALTFALSNFAADNVFGNFTGGSAGPSTQVIPACANDGSHALVYVSHVITCASITGGGGIGFQGTPTATALTTVFDSTHIQTPSAMSTMDGSGNISTPGSLTTGAGSGVAGQIALGQGTVATPVTTSVNLTAPTTVTAYQFVFPGTAGTGALWGTNVSNVVTYALMTAANVITLWSGTCNSSTFLRGDGACATPAGSGTVTSSGPPTSGQMAQFTTATNIIGVTATGTGSPVLATAPTINGLTFPTAGGSAVVSQTIASGSSLALGTSAITSGSCVTVTATATGAVSTDVAYWSPNASWKALTGYSGTGGILLTVYPPFVTSNTYNQDICNWTGSTITPSAASVNWRINR